ncbi:hypothetical protein [Pseudomonas phage DL54]|uniref:hypothetical protein n=1 Tax=Pseudomonas phage DL54 TaxID=1640969 RepID=UPI000624D171|nr:hypothetical protein AVU27_gp59 [Pseudomonas phage DL54]AKF13814.1 hypothetical protein [Pseudomonas phage DL54]
MMTYLLIIPAILAYMSVALLISGVSALFLADQNGMIGQRDRDIAIVMGALWPASLPWMCFMAVIYNPLVILIGSTKRLIKGDY